jgi:hypothetical protein
MSQSSWLIWVSKMSGGSLPWHRRFHIVAEIVSNNAFFYFFADLKQHVTGYILLRRKRRGHYWLYRWRETERSLGQPREKVTHSATISR